MLPSSALTVLAARTPPGEAWRADPAWRDLLRIVSLRNLTPEDCRAYLRASGVEPDRHDRLIPITHGHPLALSLLTNLVLRGAGADLDVATAELGLAERAALEAEVVERCAPFVDGDPSVMEPGLLIATGYREGR